MAKVDRKKFLPPMTAKASINASAGDDAGKGQKVRKPKGGAGKGMGPAIGKGTMVTGKGNWRGTGGGFAKADKAPVTRGSKKTKK